MEDNSYLRMVNISKSFPGVKALSQVNLEAVSYTHLDVYKRQVNSLYYHRTVIITRASF